MSKIDILLQNKTKCSESPLISPEMGKIGTYFISFIKSTCNLLMNSKELKGFLTKDKKMC